MAVDARVRVRTDAELATALRLGIARLDRRLRTERPADALPVGKLAVLATLERRGPSTVGALAAAENVRPPSMTRTVDHLVAGGHVRREANPADGRQSVVVATTTGREALAHERRRREAWFTEHLRALAPAERDVLRAAAPLLLDLAEA